MHAIKGLPGGVQGSPQLSVELMRFGSGLGPARHLSGLAAGSYASFHGPHEAEDRGVLAQALSRHMSGQVLPADAAPPAAAPPAAEEADEEQTVCALFSKNPNSSSKMCRKASM